MKRTQVVVLAAIALAALALGWWWWSSSRQAEPAAPPATAPALAPAPALPASAPASAALAVEPAASAAEPPIAADDNSVQAALVGLLGKPAVLTMLQTDGFAHRVAATVDNLTRGRAAARLWPVHPVPGRFQVDTEGHIAAANARRYEAFVALVTGVPPSAAAALWRRLEPQIQQAYEELGYPGKQFRVRLLEVIDHLLGMPQVAPSPAVKLTQVKGPIEPERPWVRYEYVDPALQGDSIGRRILARLEPAQRQQLLDWLRSLRQEIAS